MENIETKTCQANVAGENVYLQVRPKLLVWRKNMDVRNIVREEFSYSDDLLLKWIS